LKEFTMAIALSALDALFNPLHGLMQWLMSPLRDARQTDKAPKCPVSQARSSRPQSLESDPKSIARVQRAVRPQRAHRPLRVVRAVDRVVISGRMADVCAELDRLAALEARAALH